MAPQRQTDRFVANVDPRRSLPDSPRPTVKWKGKVGDNARRKALAVSRSGLHGLLLGPLVFETLEKWRNPSLVPVPSPPPPSPLFTPVPPRPCWSLPGSSFLPQPRYPVSTSVHGRQLTRRWGNGTVCEAFWAPGYETNPPVRGSCAPLAGNLVPKRLLAQAATQTQPRCAGSFWRSSSCPACTAAGGVERSTIEKNAYREPSRLALSHHALANNHREGAPSGD